MPRVLLLLIVGTLLVRADLILAQDTAAPVKQHVQPVASDPAAEIERRLLQLAHENFQQREAAELRLIELGPLAIPRLQDAAKTSDAELRYRLEVILRVLRSKALKETFELTDHGEFVRSVAYSPDGNLLASAGGGRETNGKTTEGSDFALRIFTIWPVS